MHESFSKDDRLPFGAYVAYNQLQQLYFRNNVHSEEDDFETNWRYIYNSTNDTGLFYMCITRNLFLSGRDVESMLSYVSYGNTLFISSENIGKNLQDTLGCSIANNDYIENNWPDLQNTFVRMSPQLPVDSSSYSYFFLPFRNYFLKYDTISTKVLGVNDLGEPDFILIFYGKGRIYLHTEPRALSNYFLLQGNNYKYFQNILAFAPQTAEHVFWDDYYNKHAYVDDGKSSLGVLLQYPQLAWAFWLTLILLLVYILFNGKRRQRVVAELPPVKNTTVNFAETIGRLYFQKKNNKNMAEKMITYFFEYVRNHFFMNTNIVNEEFIVALSRKSAMIKEDVETLFKTIDEIQQEASVSDAQLLLLNKQIEKFYKTKT